MKKIVDAIKAINPQANMKIEEDIDHITWTHGTSPISKADIEAKMAELKLNEPMNDWKDTMNESDSSMIPRWSEDILDMIGTTDLAEQTLDKYNSKKALRATKP